MRLDRVLLFVIKATTAGTRTLVFHGLGRRENGIRWTTYIKLHTYLEKHLPGRIRYTYDDGRASNIACRVTNPRSILFINTANIGVPGYLTSEEIRELSGKFVIGSHGHTHSDMTRTTAPDVEMRHSKTRLEKITGKKIQHFAFPYGAYDQRTIALAEQFYEHIYIVKRHTKVKTVLPWKHVIQRVCVSNTTTFESNVVRILLSFWWPNI